MSTETNPDNSNFNNEWIISHTEETTGFIGIQGAFQHTKDRTAKRSSIPQRVKRLSRLRKNKRQGKTPAAAGAKNNQNHLILSRVREILEDIDPHLCHPEPASWNSAGDATVPLWT
ncbi:hypothetical protein AJ78_01209 [Emergomyces pasteurianus Ep9510]|uniref:Uncharacterized protein n=1 Tax=Emergomyces pasteurianus Ep9510 TaxID=1447872 RepID=A0A1J9PSB0_9EURO|nr:hypothetical protein AJ78_01209 [Emergomyces pasteurianus Ep9510]